MEELVKVCPQKDQSEKKEFVRVLVDVDPDGYPLRFFPVGSSDLENEAVFKFVEFLKALSDGDFNES